MPRCAAMANSTGVQCEKWAVRGATVCGTHGASAPQVKRAAARRRAMDEAMGAAGRLMAELDLDVEGLGQLQALEEAVHRSAAMRRLFDYLVSTLDVDPGPSSLVGPDHLGDLAVHPYVSLQLKWTEASARIAKLAIDAGLEERRVGLAERDAQLLVDAMRQAFEQFVAALIAAGLAVEVVRQVYREQVTQVVRQVLEAASHRRMEGEG